MTGPFFSLNGELFPISEGHIDIDDIDFAYGYGVYETLKVRHGVLYFPELHEQRLYHSAGVIDLAHPFGPGDFQKFLRDLVTGNSIRDANLKALLIGGKDRLSARLYIMALNPLFPDRKLYRDGACAVTWEGERAYPQAKALNMLVSTLAYRKALKERAYDALLVNRRGEVTEGTRTNLFYTDGKIIYTPPAQDVLEGVTKLTVVDCIKKEGIEVRERALKTDELWSWEGVFLTSTSTKIMPLSQIDGRNIGLSVLVSRLMASYDQFLSFIKQGPPLDGK